MIRRHPSATRTDTLCPYTKFFRSELIALVIAAPSRESLVVRTHALDRVLLWHHFVVPNWHTRTDRIVYWDKFGYPETPPANGTSPSYWWFDEAKADRIERGLAAEPELTEGARRDKPGRER